MRVNKKAFLTLETENKETINPLEDSNKIVSEYREEKQTEERQKRKRRKKIVAEDNNDSAKLFAAGATLSLHLGINAILSRFKDVDPLTDVELKSFDEAFNNLAIKYFPSVDKFGEELTFLATIAFIILPRLKIKKSSTEKTEVNE